MKKNYAKLKKAFADDPEVLRKLAHEEMMDGMKEKTAVEIAMLIKKGDKGDTPEKGVDYFTDSEVQEIAEFVKETVKDEVRPVKGKDYFDGAPGRPGKNADETKILKAVMEKVPTAGEILAQVKVPEPKEIDQLELINKILSALPEPKIPTIDDFIKELKKKPVLELKDIKGARLDGRLDGRRGFDMDDQRWHGGGLTNITGLVTAGTDISITGSGTAADPYVINATGGGGGTPGGADTQLQYNNAGAFGGITGATTDGTVVTLTSPIMATSMTASYATASTIAIFDGSKNLISADTATYPSLTELSYVKGVTSSIQTQLNGKQATITPAALTRVDDTNVTLTLGGSPSTALLQATSLTLGWTGQLSLARGGTGANLSDPGANSLWGWDDTDNAIGFWTIGSGLSYDHATHTLTASGTPVSFGTVGQIPYMNAGGTDFDYSAQLSFNGARMLLTGAGTGQVGALHINRGDSVNQYIVLQENAGAAGSAYLTFAGSNPGAMAMGALFTAGVPTSYVFTDTGGATLVSIDEATGALNVANLTASELVATDGSKNLQSLAVATYPSLTEISYVKGVTSAIQTQLNAKANTAGGLTQFVGNGNWKVFYSDGSGDVQELALGASGEVLTSNGASSAPSFQNAGSGANTALSNLASVAINTTLVSDTDNTDALGTSAIAWSDLFLGNGAVITWSTAPSTPDITLTHSANVLTYTGGSLRFDNNTLLLFKATTDNNPGIIYADTSNVFHVETESLAYAMRLQASEIQLRAGNGTATYAILKTTNIATSDKTFEFPNTSGTLALTSDIPAAGANTALSNLAAVAINTTLVSDTDNTDDLGTSSVFWRTGYFKTSIELGATDTTITRAAAGVIAVEGISLPKGTGTTNEIAYWSDANTVGALAVATYPSLTELSYVKGVTSAIQTQINAKGAIAGQVWTGVHDFGGATSLEIPNSAAPTVDADGEIAFDTTVTDFSTGLIRFFGNEEQGVVSMPIAQFSTPQDGYVVTYNATADEFQLTAPAAGGANTALSNLAAVAINTSLISDTTNTDDLGSSSILWRHTYTTDIELGHASDTTLSRGAAGFIAVEGNRVPSPASQASGDLLYRGATEWERLAKGTAGQFLKMNSGATAPEWSSNSPDVQTFTSGTGNWTKPAGKTLVVVQVWGGGGSGGKGSASSGACGGGGGAYAERWFNIDDLASLEPYSVGAGGTGQTTANTAGNNGNNSTFGAAATLVTAYGGGGGMRGDTSSTYGGGGGGSLSQGSNTTGAGGGPLGAVSATATAGADSTFGGGSGGAGATSAAVGEGGDSFYGGGGGGGAGTATIIGGKGGNSVYGGAGGGGNAFDSSPGAGAGGTSTYGGNGGAGAFDANNGTDGTAPGGGGGGSETGTSGAGGAGRVVVTSF